MIAGLLFGAAGMALLATAGTATPLALIVAGSVLVGLVALAMPAMTAVVVGAAGPEHAGVASGILNAARQAGGALGVAVLGALLAHGNLHLPLAISAAGYLIAVILAWVSIREVTLGNVPGSIAAAGIPWPDAGGPRLMTGGGGIRWLASHCGKATPRGSVATG
jgi:MFS family permease